MIDNQRARVGRCDKVEGHSENRDNGEEVSKSGLEVIREAERVQHVEPCIVRVFRVEFTDWSNPKKVIRKNHRVVNTKNKVFLRNVVTVGGPISKELAGVVVVLKSNLFEFHGLAGLAKPNTTENTEPNQDVGERNEGTIHDNLKDRASLGNPSNKNTNKAGPRSPPCHVKYSPVVHPPSGACLIVNSSTLAFTKLPKCVCPERGQND
mmetsp:Transcript_17004/g.28229  ORF Transcript_17004/g.28229 Transcript_17004/m.28229 type:complete len:208 (-) Transcript_17004:1187-1810(-)